jgi:hypothetical protein
MENAEEGTLGRNQCQASLGNEIQRFPIPSAAQPPCMTIGLAVLPVPKPALFAAAMLEKEDTAICAAHPRHLSERNHRIGKGTQGEGLDHGVEALVTKS